MSEQFNTRKLSTEDLINDFQYNSHNREFSYSIENNQKKYSHTQKIKP